MRDAAIERLSKIIADRPTDDGSGKGFRSRRPAFEVHLGLAEGWFSLFLLATVVYSTIWSVQAVGWVEHLNVLTLTTALGLIVGVLAAKQRRLAHLPVHIIALGCGLLLAFWQTAGAFYGGNTTAFVHGIQRWLTIVLAGGVGDDDSIFLFFIVALSFVLAYTSAWLLYRTRNPWLMIVANAVVLLINLSNVDAGFVVFLIVFLMASLLLVLRFNLYESVRRWKRQGLRYSDDIGWDVMQAGAMISIGLLVFSWILPWGYTDPTLSQVWNANANPWVQLENTWNRVISVNGGVNPANRGNFRDALILAGNPNLNHDVVLTVQSDDESQYLQFLNYDTYTGRGWTNSPTGTQVLKANQVFADGSTLTHPLQQKITIVNPPGEQRPYILGASEVAAVNMPATLVGSQATSTVIAWLTQNGTLGAGTTYTVTSLVSSADEATLRTVPMPASSVQLPPDYPGQPPPTVYDPNVVHAYTQLPGGLDPRIAALAKQITANAPTMYDKAVALETYLRANYTYSVDIQLPPGQEGVSWFLFHSGNKGFCNYFASAMAVMARSLGIPARVAVGYTSGTNDPKHRQHVVHGTDAHSWTQIYFAGYGWINFEPSASFSTFTRPLPNAFPPVGIGSVGTGTGSNNVVGNKNHFGKLDASDNATADGTTAAQEQGQLRQQVGFALGSIVLLVLFSCILFTVWWRRLFRRYGLAAQLFGRICLLARWAGIELRPSQTPYEYVHGLATATPQEAETLERLGDIYVRDRWADRQSKEHPERTGEINELPGLWKHLQPRLFFYVARHPHFLRWLPLRVWSFLITLRRRQRAAKRLTEEEL
ncbi:MAG TPA: transglutaminaseTgpA domain-containing protein [Ktedonobacteraceae bacterium]|nr:transglutaminaseTgpA domain-containing protein [Ktedonobacteraceae bacterium]